nr:S-layer family protein [Desulfovibrio sp.]
MFTNMGLFYGSDYFLSRIGLDQDRQQVVLLGDAFYETRLVQQQILAATGQRFLNGYSSDADQMRGLMDAAAAQAQGLDLSVGVALTPTQVAALTQDIIWLEEEEHMGRKVLVPHLYLASATQQDIAPGGGVQAKNVYIKLHPGRGHQPEGRGRHCLANPDPPRRGQCRPPACAGPRPHRGHGHCDGRGGQRPGHPGLHAQRGRRRDPGRGPGHDCGHRYRGVSP